MCYHFTITLWISKKHIVKNAIFILKIIMTVLFSIFFSWKMCISIALHKRWLSNRLCLMNSLDNHYCIFPDLWIFSFHVTCLIFLTLVYFSLHLYSQLLTHTNSTQFSLLVSLFFYLFFSFSLTYTYTLFPPHFNYLFIHSRLFITHTFALSYLHSFLL